MSINTVLTVLFAVPAAYAFSRHRFLGDRQLFFWLLTNRMAPPAVFLLPVFQLYSAVGLFDTPYAVAIAHCVFTLPLAVWILEGFMSSVPKSIDEMARVDGHSFTSFFFRIFLPLNRGGVGVTVFFCFMFSWVELLIARTVTASEAKPHRGGDDAHRQRIRPRLGCAVSGGCDDHRAGRGGHLVPATTSDARLCLGACRVSWMAWTGYTAVFFASVVTLIAAMTLLELRLPTQRRRGFLPMATTRGDRVFISLLLSALLHLLWLAGSDLALWICTVLTAFLAALILWRG